MLNPNYRLLSSFVFLRQKLRCGVVARWDEVRLSEKEQKPSDVVL